MKQAPLIRAFGAMFAAAALGACADNYLAVDGDGHHTAAPPKLSVVEGAPLAPPTLPRTDTCGAGALQYLIGKPKTEAPVPVDPSRRRVYCATCTIARDHRPDRVDILFDQDSGVITAVKCG